MATRHGRHLLALCLLLPMAQLSAAELFRDDFNNGVYYSTSVLAADGASVDTLNDTYWTYHALPGEELSVAEIDDRLEIATDSAFGAGIVLYGNQANPDALCPPGASEGCVDPRLYFFNDPQADPAASRTIVVDGIRLTGINHPSYYAFKLRIGSTPGGLLFRSHLEVSLSGDKELRVISKVGAANAVALFRSFYLQQLAHRITLTLGPSQYTVKADFDFPPATGDTPALLSGSASYTGLHGLDVNAWLSETGGVEGGALFLGATSTDPKDSLARLSIDSVSVHDGASSLGMCQ